MLPRGGIHALTAGATYDIVELMPGDIIDHIRETGVCSLDAVAQQVRDTTAVLQTLFEMDRGERHYSI